MSKQNVHAPAKGKSSGGFLSKIGSELAAIGGALGNTKASPKAKPKQPARSLPTKPAPAAAPSSSDAAFPGLKVRRRETLFMEDSMGASGVEATGELNEQDFNDLADLLGEMPADKVPPVTPPPPFDDDDDDESSDSVAAADADGDATMALDVDEPSVPSLGGSSGGVANDAEAQLSLREELERLGAGSTRSSATAAESGAMAPEAERAVVATDTPTTAKNNDVADMTIAADAVVVAPSSEAAAAPASAPVEAAAVFLSAIPTLPRLSEAATPPLPRLSEAPPAEEAPRPVKPPPLVVKQPLKRALTPPKVAAPQRSGGDAKLKEELAGVRSEMAQLRQELEEAGRREFDLHEQLAAAVARNDELTVTAGRVTALEMQLDAMQRAAAAADLTTQQQQQQQKDEPTREELFAAMGAYRNQLEATVRDLHESEQRKLSLRDDLRKLISKSKDLESAALSWKQRSDTFEKKFAKTKELAKEYATKSKHAARDAERVDELKAQVAALERRSQKAEAMAKAAVACIKRSGSNEQKKELSAALQALQATSTTSTTVTSGTSNSSSSSAASPALSDAEKAERRKSPHTGRAAAALAATAVASTSTPPSSPAPITLTQSQSQSQVPTAVKKSPRLAVVEVQSSGYLSPQIKRKKDEEEAASKTPTVARRADPNLLHVEGSSTPVTGSPSTARKKNPVRGVERQVSAPAHAHAPEKHVSSPALLSASKATPPTITTPTTPIATRPPAPTEDAFDALENVLMMVEKDTGATGLTGNVDTSHLLSAGGSQSSASDYLAQMKQTLVAQVEQEKRDVADAKREQLRGQLERKRDTHRAILAKFLAADQTYLINQIKMAQPMLVPLLSTDASLVQSEDERLALVDAAVDTEHIGMEPVLRVHVWEGRDVSASGELAVVASVKSQHQRSAASKLLGANRAVQWGDQFVFAFSPQDVGADGTSSSRVTLTVLETSGGGGGGDRRVGLVQINLAEVRSTGKEYYPIVDNSGGDAPCIRGMMTVAVSLHHRAVARTPVKVVLDPNGKEYQDAIRHNIARIKRCEELLPKERDGLMNLANPMYLELDKHDVDLKFVAAQIRAGAIHAGDPFENVYRRTLLHLMIIAGDQELTEKCLAAGLDPKKRDIFGMLPFHLAIVHGHFALLKNLLPVMKAFGQSVHTEEGSMGLSPVHLAVIFKRPNILQWLLDLGAEPDERDEYGGLPVHKAAFVGSLPCLELLVNKRAFVKAQDKDGNDPLLLAVMEGHWDCVDYLLSNPVSKADIDTSNLRGDTCLWFAVARSNRRFTARFLETQNTSILSMGYGPHLLTLLMRALLELDGSGDEVVKMLATAMVERRVGINQTCADGKSAAFFAAFRGKTKLLAALASKGLALDLEDDFGNTALHFASTLPVAEILLHAGLSADHRNKSGNTPLHSAYAFNPEIVDFLITNGASSKLRNAAGNVPLEVSTCNGRIAMPGDATYHRATGGLFIPKC